MGTQDTGQINLRENLKGRSKIDNPETLATLGTNDTGPKQHKTQKTQHRKLKDEQHGPYQKNPGVNTGAAYKTTAVLLIDMVNYINITRKLSYMLRTL